jgi:hypothetical protein
MQIAAFPLHEPADQIFYPHLLKLRLSLRVRAKTYRHPIYRRAADYPLITAPNATPIPRP